MLQGGCSGLFVLGGCGEGAWLPSRQRGTVVRAFVRAAAGRVPVLAGVMLPATGPAVEAARQAAAEGADAVVVGSPYYFGVDGTAQRRHIETVIEAADRPALLYNIPQCTHQVLAPARWPTSPATAGYSGSRTPPGTSSRSRRSSPSRRRGPTSGSSRGTSTSWRRASAWAGTASCPGSPTWCPRSWSSCGRRRPAGDGAACTRIQGAILDLCAIHEIGHWLPALKAACAMIGIGSGVPALPLVPATETERRAIAAVLARHGIEPASGERPRRRAPARVGA